MDADSEWRARCDLGNDSSNKVRGVCLITPSQPIPPPYDDLTKSDKINLARISHTFRREAQREPCSGKEGAGFGGGLCKHTLSAAKTKPDAANAWLPQAATDKCEKCGLDIFWLKDDALEESANFPAPGIIALDFMEDLQAALEQFATIAEDLK